MKRREFIEHLIWSGAATLTSIPLLSACDRSEDSGPASDRVRIALIGMRGHGKKLAKSFAAVEGCEIATVCDVDTAVGADGVALVEELTGQTPAFEQDLRAVFDDPEIDAVVIAMPHHWHALAAVWAMQAGKHVYLEKPVTHNVLEGGVLLAAAEKYDRVVQSGTQLRSNTSMAAAAEYMQQGKLGTVNLAKCLAFKPREAIGAPGDFAHPSTVDYDLWSGPAEILPLTRERFHYDWHWSWEYGNGGLGNNGVHRVDLARWAMDLSGLGDSVISYGGRFAYNDAGETPNTQVAIHQFGARTVIQELRCLPTERYMECKNGVLFFGSDGHILYESGTAKLYDDQGGLVSEFAPDPEAATHQANFIEAVRENDASLLNGGLRNGIESSALCHVGSISNRVGQQATDTDVLAALVTLTDCQDDVADTFDRTRAHLSDNEVTDDFTLGPLLTLDSENEEVIDHPEADALMGRTYREPYVLPSPETV